MSKPKIYIDTSCFIDVVSRKIGRSSEKGKEKEVDWLNRILKAGENGDIEIYTSALTIAECRYAKEGKLNDEVKRIIKSVLSSGKIITLVEPTIFISEAARDLKWDHDISKLSGADATHIATAIDRKCSEFLTLEEKVLNQREKIQALGLKVILPSETLSLASDYLQEDINYEEEKHPHRRLIR